MCENDCECEFESVLMSVSKARFKSLIIKPESLFGFSNQSDRVDCKITHLYLLLFEYLMLLQVFPETDRYVTELMFANSARFAPSYTGKQCSV